MTWQDVGFMHWPVAPETVEATLPDGLAVDTYDGRAWLSMVPFQMADIRPRGSPIGRSFGELNLRTYVVADGTPGVYFYNLDADDRLSVTLARQLFQLSYYRESMQYVPTATASSSGVVGPVRVRPRRISTPPTSRRGRRRRPNRTPWNRSWWSAIVSTRRATTGRCTTPTSITNHGRSRQDERTYGRTACSPRRASTGPTASHWSTTARRSR